MSIHNSPCITRIRDAFKGWDQEYTFKPSLAMSFRPGRQDDGVTAWPASKQWPWDAGAVQWFEGSHWSQPGRRLANSLSRKRLEIWDQRFTSGSTLERWSWNLWQAISGTWMATWAASTGDDFASFWGLQWSCCIITWEWRRLGGKRTWTQAKAWTAALEADRSEISLASSQGRGDRELLVGLCYYSCLLFRGLGVVFGKLRGSRFGDSDSCSSVPFPVVRLPVHDCHYDLEPSADGHHRWQRTWKRNTFVKGFVGTTPIQIADNSS